MTPLKVGLLVDGVLADKYAHELAVWARGRPEIDLSHLIVLRRDPQFKGGSRSSGVARLLFRLLVATEKMRLKRVGLHGDHFRAFDMSALAVEVIELLPIASESGCVHRFRAADLQRLKALKLDLLIFWGQGVLRGGILRTSRLGVLAFHHGHSHVYRGAPPGFWECYYRWPRTGFALQRLTEERGSEVLARGYFATRRFYALNQAELYAKSLAHLKRVLLRAADTKTLPPVEGGREPDSERLFGAPDAGHCLAYAGKMLSYGARSRLAALAGLREQWGISVLGSGWRSAAFASSRPVVAPRGRFWSDPFICRRESRTWCFVEDFVCETGRGRIAVLEINGTEAIERGVALEEPFHLSFPFLFEHGETLYMCPETAQHSQIRVYRCTEFPLRWQLASVLMDGVSAVDTLLFERGGRWWLLTSIDESGTGDHCSELHLFSSDSPLASHWRPHPRNPVRFDSVGGRNAGLILEGGRIYRVAQCQGFDRYGESLEVREIIEISESRYEERRVTRVRPRFRPGLLGTHHLSSDGKTTVIDHMSYFAGG